MPPTSTQNPPRPPPQPPFPWICNPLHPTAPHPPYDSVNGAPPAIDPSTVPAPIIGLTLTNLTPKIIAGTNVQGIVQAKVDNLGGGVLDYNISYTDYTPIPSTTAGGSITSAAGQALGFQAYEQAAGVNFDPEYWNLKTPYANATPGTTYVTVTVTDPNIPSLTVTKTTGVLVVAPSDPAFRFNGQVIPFNKELSEPPSVSTEQASATGGGYYSVAAPAQMGDPDVPTAFFDLENITTTGSPLITTTLQPYDDTNADDEDPSDDVTSLLEIPTDTPIGVYQTQFYFDCSDEDIPGADAPDSQVGSYLVTADVTSDGATFTIEVPEPASICLLALPLAWIRRRRAHR